MSELRRALVGGALGVPAMLYMWWVGVGVWDGLMIFVLVSLAHYPLSHQTPDA